MNITEDIIVSLKAMEEETTNQIINDLILEHQTKLKRYKKLQNYFDAKNETIFNRPAPSDPSKPNNKLFNGYADYITTMAVGYFLGIPVTYICSEGNEEYLIKINKIMDLSDEDHHNLELGKDCSIKGEAFEVLYQDAMANTRFMKVPLDEMHVVYNRDIPDKIDIALRYYYIKDTDGKDKIRAIMYMDDKIRYYMETEKGKFQLEKEEIHYFGEVPVIHYLNNTEKTGDFEKVISLIDDFDKRLSDNSNELEYWRNAYLKIKGMMGTQPDDIKTMRENGAILVSEDGDVDFLTKNVNDTAVENHLKRLDKLIHKFSKTVDLTDESFAGNLSGVAIKFKLWCLEQLAINKEVNFKKGLNKRLRLITKILNIKGNSFDYTDLTPKFTRNIPANILELAEIINKLRGSVSNSTLLSQLPFIDDVESEIEKLEAEKGPLDDYKFPDEGIVEDE